MHKITVKQNETELLNMLAAQRQIYSDGKLLTKILVIISVVLPFIIAIIKPFFMNNSIVNLILSSIPIIVMVLSYLLKNYVTQKKTMAATIQNRFDYILYGFQWDDKKHGDLNEIQGWINKGLKKYERKNSDLNDFIDWYPINDSNIEIEKSRILCQQCNVYWDGELKKCYKNVMTVAMLIVLCIIAVFAFAFYNSTVLTFSINIFLPSAPVLFFLYTSNLSITKDIEKLGNLKHQMINLVDLMNDKGIGRDTLTKQSMDIQNQIFEHRKSGVLVLDYIYNLLKKHQGSVAKSNAQRIIENM